PGPDYRAIIGDLRITRNGQEVALLHPARHTFTAQKQTVVDTSIKTDGITDLYTVLGDESNGQWVLRLHVNFLAPWIWFGALIMGFGGALSLADRRLRIGAPARRPALTVPA
ncbi:MAG: c-type cytochrome biogenesis protein CcmF, partial [Acetobacteraceae bacterium]|nr:c-type cytochrome biogenesis protein CcmF [Acetobacteraceae bacterium]